MQRESDMLSSDSGFEEEEEEAAGSTAKKQKSLGLRQQGRPHAD
jgi:hypothetical protein